MTPCKYCRLNANGEESCSKHNIICLGRRCNEFEFRNPNDYCEKESDMVNHPKHYCLSNGIEVIDIIEGVTSKLVGTQAVDTANVIKYICRWPEKNGLQDLKKAQWYLNHLIEKIEKEND